MPFLADHASMSLRNAVSWALPNAYMIETVVLGRLGRGRLGCSRRAQAARGRETDESDHTGRTYEGSPTHDSPVDLCGIDARPQCRTSGNTIYLTHTVHLGRLSVKRFTIGGSWRYETVMDRRETPPLTSVAAPG